MPLNDKQNLRILRELGEPPIFEHVVPAAQVSPTQSITTFSKGWTMSSNGTLMICEDYDNHSAGRLLLCLTTDS